MHAKTMPSAQKTERRSHHSAPQEPVHMARMYFPTYRFHGYCTTKFARCQTLERRANLIISYTRIPSAYTSVKSAAYISAGPLPFLPQFSAVLSAFCMAHKHHLHRKVQSSLITSPKATRNYTKSDPHAMRRVAFGVPGEARSVWGVASLPVSLRPRQCHLIIFSPSHKSDPPAMRWVTFGVPGEARSVWGVASLPVSLRPRQCHLIIFSPSHKSDPPAMRWVTFGVPGEARTLNEGVGGPCFIQLDYGHILNYPRYMPQLK